MEEKKVGSLEPGLGWVQRYALPPYDRLVRDNRVINKPSVIARSGTRTTTIVLFAEVAMLVLISSYALPAGNLLIPIVKLLRLVCVLFV